MLAGARNPRACLAHRIVAPNLREHVGMQQLFTLVLPEERAGVKEAIPTGQAVVQKEIAALRSLTHIRSDEMQRLAQRARQSRPASLPLLDTILVITGEQLIATVA